MVRRLVQLYVGLALYGLSTAMFIRSDLGVDPRNVFTLASPSGRNEHRHGDDFNRGCGAAAMDPAASASGAGYGQ